MRRRVVLPAVAGLAVGAFAVALTAPRFTADAAVVAQAPVHQLPVPDQRYGIVHYDRAAHRWAVLNTIQFRPAGLTTVSCSASTGRLTIGYEQLATIATFSVDESGPYAGRYAADTSIAGDDLSITIRKSSNGAAVPCGASQLRIAGSGLQVSIVGSIVAPPIPASPIATTTMPPPKPDDTASASASSTTTTASPTPPLVIDTDPTDADGE